MFQRAFSVSTREPAALLFAPGGHSPTGVFVAWCNAGTFVRLCFGVSCGIARARSFVCTIACVHDRGRAVPVAVVHGRAWPSCLWPWCRGRDHGRAVSAVAVRHVVAVAVITAALGVRRAWPWCRGFCVAVVWLQHAD